MKVKLLALALIMGTVPAVTMAQSRSYSYLEAGYLSSDPDGLRSGDGFYARASGDIADGWHVFGGWSGSDNHGFEFNQIDVERWNIGLGYHVPVHESWDLVARAGYQKTEFDFESLGSSGSGDGYIIDVSVRGDFNPAFEGWVGLRHEDNDFEEPSICGLFSPPPGDCTIGREQNGRETALYLGGQWKFAQNWGVSAEISVSDRRNEITIGPRISF